MNVTLWIAMGVLAGLLAGKLAPRPRQHFAYDPAVGMAGALFGGTLFGLAQESNGSGINPWSLLGCVVGALFALSGYRAVAQFGVAEARKGPPDPGSKDPPPRI
jgi:uncharacterized membrane protein YeaQ/YmgE (transglycosylase-associated protein family)